MTAHGWIHQLPPCRLKTNYPKQNKPTSNTHSFIYLRDNGDEPCFSNRTAQNKLLCVVSLPAHHATTDIPVGSPLFVNLAVLNDDE
jgi:hypothetical protein